MGAAYSKLVTSGAWKNAPNWQRFGAVNFLARLLAYWGPNFILMLVARFGLFAKYKIQPDREPAAELVAAALKDNVLSDIVALPALAYPLYKMLTAGGGGKESSKAAAAEDRDTGDAGRENAPIGWAGLQFDAASRPSAWTIVWQVAVAYLGYDLLFYSAHRALHSQWLYKNVHKQHHLFRTSIGIASSYQHVVEGAIQIVSWFLPIGFAGWLNKRLTNGKQGLHVSTILAYNVFRWLETVDAHCGYVFPFSPFANAPWLFGGARAHDLHHSGKGLEFVELEDGSLWANFGNYGATVIWDKLFGTHRDASV